LSICAQSFRANIGDRSTQAVTAKLDATKFNWSGDVTGFFVSDRSPAQTLQQVLVGTPLRVGSTPRLRD
jgi:hypothetical protein